MKEIIYLDTNLMNSMLAQLDEGLINNFSLEQSTQESETEGQQTVRGKNAGFRGSVNASSGFLPGGGLRLDANIGNNGTESTNESRTMLEGQRDILNKAFHDHALEVLTNKLIENDLLCNGDQLKEGDLYLGESVYRFYDFNLIKKAMNPNLMENVMLHDINQLGLSLEEAKKIVRKSKPNAQERQQIENARRIIDSHQAVKPVVNLFDQMNLLSTFASDLLEDLTIVKASNYIGLLKKSYLRESTEALSFRTDKSRTIKFLVRVIGKKEVVFDGYNLTLKENELDLIPNMMIDIILGSFNIIEKGDLIVTPIAIYYE
ncbi:DUF6414 family protein [Cytobacillus firmus]|uniref:DUF6414 family protein n=1 Tax=Cytobacillus firmus TaxID=1399 RepID=UPI00249507E3|nr:hypothetical protein [Cytobacillus firmus]